MKKDVNVRQFLLCDGLGTLTLVILLILVAMFQMGCGRASFNPVELSCAVVGDEIQCPNGSVFPLPKDGRDGAPGAPGLNGVDGQDGADGANGQDGAQGEQGPPGLNGTTVQIVYPCGDDSIRHSEILLLIDGVYVAYFQHIVRQGGSNSPVNDVEGRLTVLEEGVTYMLTDGSLCVFSIVDGQVVSHD